MTDWGTLRLLAEEEKVIGLEIVGDHILTFPQVSFHPMISEVLKVNRDYSPKIQYHKNGTLKSILVGRVRLVKV